MSEEQINTESEEQAEESKEVEGSGPKPLFEETEEDKANREAESSDDEKAEEESKEEEESEESEEEKSEDDSEESKEEDDDSKEEDKEEEIKLSLPKESVLTEDALERIALFAKEQGLNNKQANAIVKEQDTAIKSHLDSQKAEHEHKATVDWIEEIKADKEIGGEHFNESIEHAKRAAEEFFPEAIKVLDETLYGNWPPLVKGMARIGKMMSDDTFVSPGAQPTARKSMEDIFYGNTTKE